MKRYDPASLRHLVQALAEAAGMAKEDAAIFADALLDADLQGNSTHGVSRAGIYLKRIDLGQIDPGAELSVRERYPGLLSIDAMNGVGQVQAVRTLDRMMEGADQRGFAAATIRRSQHFGALGYYSNRAAERDMILLATTNCEPAMSPTGGYEPFFGTNPIAASFPTGRGWPVKIDLATSIVARGNIIAAQREGRSIPEGWALDPEGRGTTDPDAALAGTVLTMAGHKGYALALLVEFLSGALSGAAIGPGIGSMYKDLDRPQDVGHFFCLLKIHAFADPGEFRRRVDATIDRLKASATRPGVDEVFVPGERSARTARENARRGIPLAEATVRELADLAERYGVDARPQPAGGEGAKART